MHMWIYSSCRDDSYMSNACYVQVGNFLEELFAKAVAFNLHDCELCIDPRVSCGDSKAGVNVNEVKLSTILSAMNVRKASFYIFEVIWWVFPFSSLLKLEFRLQNIGVLDTRLAQTADLLFKQIVHPIVQDPGFAINTKELDQQGRAVISWNSSASKVLPSIFANPQIGKKVDHFVFRISTSLSVFVDLYILCQLGLENPQVYWLLMRLIWVGVCPDRCDGTRRDFCEASSIFQISSDQLAGR